MILKGDCIEVMKAMKPNSVDAICTDPPYGLEFMGKEWDKLEPNRLKQRWAGTERKLIVKKEGQPESSLMVKKNFKSLPLLNQKKNPQCLKCGHYKFSGTPCKCENPQWKVDNYYQLQQQHWHTQWLTEAYRVLKPGGSMLVMGGTRTSHRLACAIEDSGFIIKDTLMWIYGSGFPKAQDLGKLIDKRNGRKAEDFKRLGNYLKEQRLKKGLNTNDIGRNFPSKSGGITGCYRNWEYGNNVPTLFQWKTLKKLLNLDNEFDWLIKREEAEREKIGEINKARAKGQKSALPTMGAKTEYMDIDITIPTTDLAKHWDGFKVGGVKPAYEPIIWAVKPPEGSYVDNVLKWGVGAVNVDECRIGLNQYDKEDYIPNRCGHKDGINHIDKLADKHNSAVGSFGARGFDKPHWNTKGRFPANIILSHHPECVQVGVKRVKNQGGVPDRDTDKNSKPAFTSKEHTSTIHHFGKDGLETVESWDCHPDCAVRLLDEQSGVRQSKWGKDAPDKISGSINYVGENRRSQQQFRGDSGGASRFFKQCNYGQEEWLCHEGCALRQLDEQSGILKSGANPERRNSAKTKTCYGEFEGKKECISYRGQNSGGASRFLYCAKASRGERNVGLDELPKKDAGHYNQSGRRYGGINTKSWKDPYKKFQFQNNHPTVKPIKLFEWLIKLVTREGQIVLDPFIGSGTTGIAAHNTKRKCVGIEKEGEYLEIAKRRTAYWRSRPRQLEII